MPATYRHLALLRGINVGGKNLIAKYVFGKDTARFQNCFNFPVQNESENILAHILQQKQSFWLNKTNVDKHNSLINNQVKKCLGVLDFFAMPLLIGNSAKGIIYADCKHTGRDLKQQDYQAFCHFCENANIALDILSSKK